MELHTLYIIVHLQTQKLCVVYRFVISCGFVSFVYIVIEYVLVYTSDIVCREKPVRDHLKNVYGCLTLSTISAGVGAYIHMYTELLSAGLLTVLGSLGLLMALMVTPDNGKNTGLRMGYLFGFSFFAGT